MSLASHMLGRSRKFTNAPSLLLQEHALFIRRFVNDAHSSVVKGDGMYLILMNCRISYCLLTGWNYTNCHTVSSIKKLLLLTSYMSK